MKLGQYLLVRVTPDGKQYEYWVVDQPPPIDQLNSLGNRTTSASTLATAIQNEMPTLST